MKEPTPHVRAALESIAAIESYRPEDEQTFMTDDKTQDAILMRLLDIGENLGRIRQSFPEFWEACASDDWQRAIGLRNVIAHDYGSVDLGTIWQVITSELAKLAESLSAVIPTTADADEQPSP